MAEFDDLLDQQPQEAPPQEGFDKEAYAAQKKQEREAVYALADQTATDVADMPAKFAQYLDTQARFDRYSATNALLIMAQRPGATWIGSLDYWKQQKVFIKPGELKNHFTILARGGDFRLDDGGVGVGVDMKRVYDVAQAQRPRLQPEPRFDERAFAALKKAAPMPVQGVDGLGQDAVIRGNTIFVQKGMGREATIIALAREACRAGYQRGDGDPKFADLAARAGAYMICKKYGVDTKGIDLSDSPDYLGVMEPRDARDTLSDVRAAASEITGRMAKELEPRKPEAR